MVNFAVTTTSCIPPLIFNRERETLFLWKENIFLFAMYYKTLEKF